MGTKVYDSALDLITFTRASGGTALRRVGYGPELVTNGGFDTSDITSWGSFDGTLAVVSGELELTYTAATQYAWVSVPTEAGKTYQFTIDGKSPNAVGWKLLAYADAFPAGTGIADQAYFTDFSSSFTTKSINVKATSGTTLFMVATLLTAGVAYLDNISVKEVFFDRASDPLVLFNHPTNIPRIEYAADGTLKGLLVEEARTNLLLRSEEFDNASWVKGNSTVTANTATAPDGTTTADTFIPNSGQTAATLAQSISVTSAAYSISFYAKSSGQSSVSLVSNLTGTFRANVFNLATEAATAGTGWTASIVSVGNGWYLCSCSATADTTASKAFQISNNSTGWTGDGISGVYLWGAQLEAGAFPTSYIPTAGATATRAADIASIPVSAFGYNQKAGSVVVEGMLFGANLSYLWSLYADTSNRIMGLRTQALYVEDGGVAQASIDTTDLENNTTIKSSGAYKFNDFAASVNGEPSVSDTSGTVPSVTTMGLGVRPSQANFLNGHIKSIAYYPRRLSNAQLQELTS